MHEKGNFLRSRSFHVCLKKRERVGDESQSHVTKGTTRRQLCPGFLSGRLGKSQSMCKRREIKKQTAKNRFISIFLAQATTALNGAT